MIVENSIPSGISDANATVADFAPSPTAAVATNSNPIPSSPLPLEGSVTRGAVADVVETSAAPLFSSFDPGPAGVDLELEAAIAALEAEWARLGIGLSTFVSLPKYASTFRTVAASAIASAVNSKSVSAKA